MLKIRKGIFIFLQKIINLNLLKGRFFKKSLFIILLGAYLPTIAVGIISYNIASNQILSEVKRTHSLQLQQSYNNIDEQVMNLHVLSAQAVINPILHQDLVTTNLSTQFDRYSEILGSLRVMESSSTILFKALLFTETALGDAEMSYKDGLHYLEKDKTIPYSELLDQPGQYFWVESSIFGIDKATSSIALVQKLQYGGGDTYGLLILFLDTRAITQIVRKTIPDNEEIAMILGDKGQFLTSVNNLDENSIEEIVRINTNKAQDYNGNFTLKNKKEEYLITYETIARNGWKFVMATPLSRMMAPVRLTSYLELISCIIIMLLSIFVSFLASGTIYKPIKSLMGTLEEGMPSQETRKGIDEIKLIEDRWKSMYSERRTLQIKLEQNKNFLKNSFLMQLLQGHLYFIKEEELKSQFRQYWWEPEGRIFSTLIIRINSFSNENGQFLKDDKRLVTFAAGNIIEEILSQRITDSAVVNFHDLTLTAVIAFSADTEDEEIKRQLENFSNEIISTLSNFLNFHVTVVIGQSTTRLQDIFAASEDARQALRLRLINKNTQVIDLESLNIQKDSQATYPYAIEKRIIDVVLSGMKDEAVIEIQRFIKKLYTVSATELFVKQSLMQLLGNLLHLFMRTGLNPEIIFPGKDFYSELEQIQDIKDVPEWFGENLIAPYLLEVDRINEEAFDDEECVEKTIELLKKEYSKPISLELCADRVEMTPKTLSIKFKEYVGMNFIDYLTKLRLDKAKDLLGNSQLSVNEVAEAVGYEPKYFMRIFKKQEGITAGSYRETINNKGLSQ